MGSTGSVSESGLKCRREGSEGKKEGRKEGRKQARAHITEGRKEGGEERKVVKEGW